MRRGHILPLTALALCALAFFLPRIAQDPAYHQFADARVWLGISNFGDVVSNLPFLIAALLGYRRWREPNFGVFLLGLALTCVGSSYYHLAPSTERLFWDRLPMTIAFMGFFCLLIEKRISPMMADRLLIPLIAIGILSVEYWRRSELASAGDLRAYALVQFGTIALSVLLLILYRGPKPSLQSIALLFVLYLSAKLLEHLDAPIFSSTGGAVSGHTLKHLAAGLGCCVFVWLNRFPDAQLRVPRGNQ